MKTVRDRLGAHRSSEIVKPTWLVVTDGNIVTLNLKSTYEKGEATEEVSFFVNNKKEASLIGWRIDSPLLVLPGAESF